MIQTKRKLSYSVLLVISTTMVLMTGCTSKEYKDAMENGNKALSNEKYSEAVEAYTTALKYEPEDNTAKNSLDKAKSKIEEKTKPYQGEWGDVEDEENDFQQLEIKGIEGQDAFLTITSHIGKPQEHSLTDKSIKFDENGESSFTYKDSGGCEGQGVIKLRDNKIHLTTKITSTGNKHYACIPKLDRDFIRLDKNRRIAAIEEKMKVKQSAEQSRESEKQGVSIGMTKEQVLNSTWGKPQSVNKTTTIYGTREQWVYGNGNFLYFDDGVLTGIQN